MDEGEVTTQPEQHRGGSRWVIFPEGRSKDNSTSKTVICVTF